MVEDRQGKESTQEWERENQKRLPNALHREKWSIEAYLRDMIGAPRLRKILQGLE